MDVDHFQPKGKGRHRYTNLLVATRHCNGAKSNKWPTRAESRAGLYIINPYTEQDYGKHIFEDPKTHHIVATSPAGFYHILVVDLNAPHLVKERAERSRIGSLLKGAKRIKSSITAAMGCVHELKRRMDVCIPAIPHPPAGVKLIGVGK